MAKHSKNRHRGSRVDEWLKAEGIFEGVTQQAMKEIIAWQLEETIQAVRLRTAPPSAFAPLSRARADHSKRSAWVPVRSRKSTSSCTR